MSKASAKSNAICKQAVYDRGNPGPWMGIPFMNELELICSQVFIVLAFEGFVVAYHC